MSLRDQHILSIGECMIELARESDGRYALAFGGDTFNTAVYLARLGGHVSYLTALGNDPYSGQVIDLAHSEGIGTDYTQIVEGRSAGLYLIETDNGERSFWYWRESAPAREIFSERNAAKSLAALEQADVIYLSGITLSLYPPKDLKTLADGLASAKSHGTKVVMDSNYRPRGWPDGRAHAKEVFQQFWALADIALPTFDDEQALWDEQSPKDTTERLTALGVSEVCVKIGPDGAYVASEGQRHHVATEIIASPVDTTAAGDSFNAAYLAARLSNRAPAESVAIANRLAGIVVSHRGAIAPKSATNQVKL